MVLLEGASHNDYRSRQAKSRPKLYFKTMENLDMYQKSLASTRGKIEDTVSKINPKKHFNKKLIQLNIGKLSKNHRYVGLRPPLDEKLQKINSSHRDHHLSNTDATTGAPPDALNGTLSSHPQILLDQGHSAGYHIENGDDAN